MLKASRKTFEEVRALCFDFTPASAYAAIGCPALVLCGSESPSIEQRVCERLAEAIPGAERKVVTGAGHLGVVRRAAELGPMISEWIAAKA